MDIEEIKKEGGPSLWTAMIVEDDF
ncbi:uncharacterized protein G2W53_039257 [Senna tora]|uniref:Uncharacterized protein n=1 Tax=Senna tora TaxID=362788 RepID=A0A834W5Z1_9FABA|nr:uncharacterized protein G2W53_039257 [Senna tora]